MTKIFRIDYYPSQAYMDFSRMNANEIAVIIQIINLIYMNQGAIENDPKWISRSITDMGSSKCRNIIKNLVEKGDIILQNDGKIHKKMCQNQLKTVENRRENASNSGKKGAEIKHENKQNQTLKSSNPKKSAQASTSTSTSTSNNKHSTKDDENHPDYDPEWFCGHVIKLRKKDFHLWLERYGGTNDQFNKWLDGRDEWFSTQAPEIKKNWFMSTSAAISKLTE
jgi:uncharacterized protein YdaU (DUF1376 family)